MERESRLTVSIASLQAECADLQQSLRVAQGYIYDMGRAAGMKDLAYKAPEVVAHFVIQALQKSKDSKP